jgi:hypothetical protein
MQRAEGFVLYRALVYEIIYEVIMRKFRASMEPFRDLKIGKYVEYLMPVSNKYLIS